MIGFVLAAQDENYEAAAKYFQPPAKGHRAAFAEEQELAAQLIAVLNARFPTSALDSITQGGGEEGPPQDLIRVGGTHVLSESFPLYLIRLEDAHGNKLWYISRQTLAQVPEVYDSLRFPRIEKELPAFLVKNRPLGMPLWQWTATVLFVPMALVLGWLVALLTRWCWKLIRRVRGLQPLPYEPLRRFGRGRFECWTPRKRTRGLFATGRLWRRTG